MVQCCKYIVWFCCEFVGSSFGACCWFVWVFIWGVCFGVHSVVRLGVCLGIHLGVQNSQYSCKYIGKVWGLENNTNLNSIFCLIKSSDIVFIFLPTFYLIMWVLTCLRILKKYPFLKR